MMPELSTGEVRDRQMVRPWPSCWLLLDGVIRTQHLPVIQRKDLCRNFASVKLCAMQTSCGIRLPKSETCG